MAMVLLSNADPLIQNEYNIKKIFLNGQHDTIILLIIVMSIRNDKILLNIIIIHPCVGI